MYTISETAKMLGIKANAIRFYEKKGLLFPVRKENGYREYSREEIRRLEMISLYRQLGFSIEAIKKLMDNDNGDELLDRYATQYEMVNKHIHTMCKVRDVIGKSVENLLNGDTIADKDFEEMESVIKEITLSNQWKDEWGFDNWAANYDKDIREEGNGLGFYKNYDLVLRKTASYVKASRVVEVGIGTGNLAKEILSAGIEPDAYIGVDQSINMLKEARKKCSDIGLRIGTFLQLPLESGSCDTVVSSYAFHHCNWEEKIAAVKEMKRILSNQGRIVITDLMFADAKARIQYESTCTQRVKEELQYEFFANVDELEKLLLEEGLSCKKEQIDELIWVIVADRI